MSERVIDKFLNILIHENASDMFLTFNEHPTIRINTKIFKAKKLDTFDDTTLNTIANELIITENGRKKFLEELAIDLSIEHNGRRFRINVSKNQGHIMIIIRLLMQDIPPLEAITQNPIIHDLIRRPSGIILVAGPTGSGKSTLLAAMIQEINMKKKKHIISIEDPIEYVFNAEKSIIEQKELHKDVISFASALKSALRQDPDVILFGEMRDKESIKNAITLAETGHLVLTTIHSKSTGQTISKIVDSFPGEQQNQIRMQLSETLLSIISQRMLYSRKNNGIALAQEIMINNSAISNKIRKNDIKGLNNIIMTGSNQGMKILEKDLIRLIESEEITLDDGLLYANNPRYILEYFENS